MKEKEILELTEANELGAMRRIKHPKNPAAQYEPTAVIQMHCDDGEWRKGIVYEDIDSEELYCRRADDFTKFEEVV